MDEPENVTEYLKVFSGWGGLGKAAQNSCSHLLSSGNIRVRNTVPCVASADSHSVAENVSTVDVHIHVRMNYYLVLRDQISPVSCICCLPGIYHVTQSEQERVRQSYDRVPVLICCTFVFFPPRKVIRSTKMRSAMCCLVSSSFARQGAPYTGVQPQDSDPEAGYSFILSSE